ncbi:hypothetical protein ZIOFF_073212 [Zingiber officinale]|uniref:DNA topoisomerase I DNA binding eukaryotic-type domain-containing protein n=1 Tax=Zingiber officinale TaxID=94328 RepID=A0A8J5ESK8_ZINOF|nr:hypothetical protein ZIOFF_073212 [Zingiber officinale]
MQSKTLDKKGTNSKTSSYRAGEKRPRNEEINDSEDQKPLLLRLQSKALNGSAKKGTNCKTSDPRVGERRPHGDTNPAESSPIKKAKLLGTSVKVKQEDDGDRKPTAQAIMKSPSFSKLLKTPPGSHKWTTLEHNGVVFPPPYKPHGIKMLYEGRPVDLTPEQEEVATMFAVMKDRLRPENPIHRKLHARLATDTRKRSLH